MSASLLFSVVNMVALLGWLGLVAAIILKKPFWRDVVIGQIWPATLSAVYTILIVFFWTKAEGGFDSLANVQKLFTYEWVALAGWVHYLAFDLFVGAWIAKRIADDGLPRLVLVPLLPLTFLFGPIGLFGFYGAQLMFRKVSK